MAPRRTRQPTCPGREPGPGGNNARLYKFTPQQRAAIENDRFARINETYDRDGGDRSNLFYGYVRKPAA